MVLGRPEAFLPAWPNSPVRAQKRAQQGSPPDFVGVEISESLQTQ